jgi:DNA ligase (NAD+)
MAEDSRIDELVRQLTEARRAYYNEGDSSLSDAEFDKLEDELRVLAPEHNYFKQVGIKTAAETAGRIRHIIPMLSAGKAKTLADVERWLKRLKLPENEKIMVEPKIDGLSAACRYVDGRLTEIATRGDGYEGQDITHIGRYLDTVPKQLKRPLTLEVRGELYLPKNTAYNTGGRPLRNNTVGLVNRKEAGDDVGYVHFTAYNIVGYTYNTEEEALALLKNLGFFTVDGHVCRSNEDIAAYYDEYIDKLRDDWEYETDGLMLIVNDTALQQDIDRRWIVDHHHHYSVAFKPPAASKTTPLKSVEWQISRAGLAIPVALFEPIELGGAVLERATLHNAKYVRELHLVKGDTLLIERANDVIPYVRDNVSRHGRSTEGFIHAMIITVCPSCGSRLIDESVHIRCPNPACPEVNIQKILYWVRSAGMENIAEATVRQLYAHNLVCSITDLYNLKPSDFLLLPGFGEKKTSNFFSEIEKSRTMDAVSFISRLGIRQVGEKSLKKLGVVNMTDFFSFNDDYYVIGKNLIEWRDNEANRTLLNELMQVLVITETPPDESSLGEVCMTGKGPLPRHQLEEKLREKGYVPTSSVTRKTVLLICENPEEHSAKLEKARKLHIEIISYHDFFGNDPELL